MANLYRAQASLDPKYAPLIQKEIFLYEQISRSEFPEKRKAGSNNLDLQLDGGIYPPDAQTGKRLKFMYLKEFLEFVGDGEAGLLGYIKGLALQNSESIRSDYIAQISIMKTKVLQLQTEIDVQQRGLEVIPGFVEEINNLGSEQLSHVERLNSLQMDVDVGYAEKLGLELECRLVILEKERLMIAHKEELQQD